MTISDQLKSPESSFDAWLIEYNSGPWSITHLTDAQKESLIWVLVSFAIIVAFWKGIPLPWGKEWKTVYVVKHGRLMLTDGGSGAKAVRQALFLKWLPILLPVKYQTVLFHECCHAIVGWLSGGRPVYILIDASEGGVTYFDPRYPPNFKLTYPAGYIGSCIIGCVCLYAGFDTVVSKYAFLVLLGLAALSTLLCICIMPKSIIHHEWYMICHLWHRHILRDGKKAGSFKDADEAYRKKCLDQSVEISETLSGKDYSDRDKMVSIEEILLVNVFIGTLIGVAWYFDDSVYLRFAILAIGNMNAWYAIFDIYLDGFKFCEVSQSDITLLAETLNEGKKEEDQHSERFYAAIALSAEIVVFIAAVIGALFSLKDTVAEQAIHSRAFLATNQHLGALELASQAGDNVGDWLS